VILITAAALTTVKLEEYSLDPFLVYFQELRGVQDAPSVDVWIQSAGGRRGL